ncbi:hypothetical protein BC941DRAFT_465710 [Chlamydoabsidia padenii]|nr:hypothetical protein BC941DRAFT_465710 [Chlamydoabsidia padenii]
MSKRYDIKTLTRRCQVCLLHLSTLLFMAPLTKDKLAGFSTSMAVGDDGVDMNDNTSQEINRNLNLHAMSEKLLQQPPRRISRSTTNEDSTSKLEQKRVAHVLAQHKKGWTKDFILVDQHHGVTTQQLERRRYRTIMWNQHLQLANDHTGMRLLCV